MAKDPDPKDCAMRILGKYIKHDMCVGKGFSYIDIMNFQGSGMDAKGTRNRG